MKGSILLLTFFFPFLARYMRKVSDGIPRYVYAWCSILNGWLEFKRSEAVYDEIVLNPNPGCVPELRED